MPALKHIVCSSSLSKNILFLLYVTLLWFSNWGYLKCRKLRTKHPQHLFRRIMWNELKQAHKFEIWEDFEQIG